MSKVSVVMTVFNREKYLATAIESVLSQTYDNLEFIIWDDGSTDRSIEIAAAFALADQRIKHVAKPHAGRISSLIEATKIATGEYLGLVDSDDYLSPNCVEASLKVMEAAPHIGMTYTNCHFVNERDEYISPRPQNSIPYSRDRLLVDFICFHFRLYRRRLFEQVGGYDPKQERGEDYDLALKLSEITDVKYIPEADYYYRQHDLSLGTGARVERIYWAKQAIANSLLRSGDKRKIEVLIPHARFKLSRAS